MIDNGRQGHKRETLPPISKNWLEMGLLYQHSMVYKTYKIDSHEIQSVFTYLWGIDIQIAMCGGKKYCKLNYTQSNSSGTDKHWKVATPKLVKYTSQPIYNFNSLLPDLFIVGPSWLWRVVHIWNPPKLVSLIFFTFLMATSHYTSIIRVK